MLNFDDVYQDDLNQLHHHLHHQLFLHKDVHKVVEELKKIKFDKIVIKTMNVPFVFTVAFGAKLLTIDRFVSLN